MFVQNKAYSGSKCIPVPACACARDLPPYLQTNGSGG